MLSQQLNKWICSSEEGDDLGYLHLGIISIGEITWGVEWG